MIYFLWSLRYGEIVGPNPWNAAGLEWKTASPPITENFEVTPVVNEPAYNYGAINSVEVS
jgi:cytochrome c oxidase subunit 1